MYRAYDGIESIHALHQSVAKRRVQIVCTHALSCTARQCAGMCVPADASIVIVGVKVPQLLASEQVLYRDGEGNAPSAPRLEISSSL
jgi:hypothetical protein